MHRFIRALPAILAFACSAGTPPGPLGPGDPDPPSAPLEGDVLFIGNSLTESNDLPGIVKVLAESAGTPGLRTAAILAGGAALEDHWRSTLTLETIAQGNWRYVLLEFRGRRRRDRVVSPGRRDRRRGRAAGRGGVAPDNPP
jgi:hypothetical protein